MSRCISHGTPFAELSSESVDKDCQKVESVCSTLGDQGWTVTLIDLCISCIVLF